MKTSIEHLSWRDFEKVADQYPFKLPRLFTLIDDDVLLSPTDIAEMLGNTPETVRSWCRSGKLRVVSPIGRYMVMGDDLKEFMFDRFKNDFLKD
jgi:DNA-directed RNA polymerase specialized sigma24 family protein